MQNQKGKKLSETTEITAGVSNVSIFDDSAAGFSASLQIGINKKLDFGIGFSTGDDTDAIGINLRSYY